MKVPRNLSGIEAAKVLKQFGYSITRQSGSHVRLTTQENGEHNVTIPLHNPLRIGTLVSILDAVALHFQITRGELISRLKF